jgi:CO/xanthine dehydrogenase Mo-binding subunit
MNEHTRIVGASVPKRDAKEKVLGQAHYIADMTRPGMLHAAILQSHVAHARILGYDISEALKVPGVHAVLTGDDVGDFRMGAFIKDETAIAKEKILYLGEPVAAVAAEDEATARYAARLINVMVEELPGVFSPEAALAPGAPILHEKLDTYFKVFPAICGGNLMSETEISEGDIAKAWSECDIVVEGEFETQPQYHLSMEPCGALSEIDSDGRITLWSANQSVFRIQANVCESLGIPMSRLRCLTPKVGAGFGNKMEPHIQPICVALTMKTGRPVKLILNRTEDFETVRARHPFKVKVKTGARKDGTLVAREVETLLDGGAFGDDSPGVLGYSLLMARGPYRIPNVRCHGRVVYTNKMRFGAFRGFGNPQVSLAGESQIDEIADKLGIDRFEIRLKNALSEGERWFGGQVIKSSGLIECLEKARAASQAVKHLKNQAPPGKRRGRGIAVAGHISGLLSTGANVRLLEDGTAVLNTGAVDIGQGSDTVLTQICAEALKLPLDKVALASPDTDSSPYNWGTTASRVTYTTGRAVVAAAGEVERQIKDHAAAMLSCSADDLELRDGGFVGIRGSNTQLPYLAVSARAHWGVGGPITGTSSLIYDTPTIDVKHAAASGLPFGQIGVFSFCVLVCEVDVDETTGKVELVRAWYAADVGRAINPRLVEVQMEGGFVQGMGFALTEELVWEDGRLVNPNLRDYKAPTMLEAPFEIHCQIVEHPEPDGPYGAKGAGEISLVPVPAAIANAIADAAGIRLTALPFTPERVLMAMLAKQS